MGFVTLLKVLKALFLFLREMWLRDRTFRQFVHENLPLIVAYVGFSIMTGMFGYLYTVVRDQEVTIERYERRQTDLQRELDEKIPYLNDQLDWYKGRYYDLKSNSPPETAKADPPRATSARGTAQKQKSINPPPGNNPVASNPTPGVLKERWKRLSE